MSGLRDSERLNTLVDLIELRRPVIEAAEAVGRLPWDSDFELVILMRTHAAGILDRYLEGELTTADAEQWANAVEGRDDIGFEQGYEELLRTFVFEVANPVLAEPITENYARAWKMRLLGVV